MAIAQALLYFWQKIYACGMKGTRCTMIARTHTMIYVMLDVHEKFTISTSKHNF